MRAKRPWSRAAFAVAAALALAGGWATVRVYQDQFDVRRVQELLHYDFTSIEDVRREVFPSPQGGGYQTVFHIADVDRSRLVTRCIRFLNIGPPGKISEVIVPDPAIAPSGGTTPSVVPEKRPGCVLRATQSGLGYRVLLSGSALRLDYAYD